MATVVRLRWATTWLLLVPVAAAILLSKYLSTTRRAPQLPPVVVVPGYATNELDARLTELYRPSSPRCGARKGEGWFRLYLNYTALEDAADVRCFAEQMAAVYDAASDDYRNALGVETRVPFFGSNRGFRYPDPDRRNFSYMDKFVSRLEGLGYRDDEILFGAPYDFRYAVAAPGHPSRVGDAFFGRLKSLVERASRLNGGTLAHQFLLRRPLPWRRRFVPVAAPWGGVVLGMLTLVAGNNLGLPFVDPLALRGEYQSLQSSLWPLPNTNAFGAGQPLVTTRSRTYTAHDVADFLDDIGMGAAIGPYQSRVLPLFRELPSPRVPVACVVGVGVDTPEVLAYPRDDFHVTPRMVMGDGDGLVNLASLLAVDPAWRRPAAYFRMLKLPAAYLLAEILHWQILAMANPSNDKGRSPAPPRRSRTKRDPSGDKVYSVPPQDFADTVQRLTGAATAQSSQAPVPVVATADGAPRRRSRPPAPALLSVSTPRSMQEAYLAWCASNNVVLSPGTMAEMERGAQS